MQSIVLVSIRPTAETTVREFVHIIAQYQTWWIVFPTQAPSTLYPPTPKGCQLLCWTLCSQRRWKTQGGGSHGRFAWSCLEVAKSFPSTFHSSELKCHLAVFPEKKGEAVLANNKPVSAIEMIYFLVSYHLINSSPPKMASCLQSLSFCPPCLMPLA